MPNPSSFTYKFLTFISKQPLQITRGLARLLAMVANHTRVAKTAKAADLNIRIALPHIETTERERIVKEAVKNELTSYFEFFNVWGSSNSKNISRVHHVEGEHYFHDAIAAQKGLILLVPHFGTWEIMNAWIAQHSKMTIMYKPIKNDDADLFVRQARSRENATLAPTNDSGIRAIFKALKQGGTTVILPDHTPHIHGSLVNYFNVPLHSSNLSAKLVQKTKATALFLYAIRNDNAGFDMYIEPVSEKIYECSDIEGTTIIHELIEGLIQKYPEHYHWSYKRFKAHPELHDIYTLSEADALAKVEHVKQTSHLSS